MDINIWAVVAATVAQFIVGMIWYTPVFGKIWGKMHGFDQLSKEKQKEMMSEMGPYYGFQLVVTIVTAYALAKLIAMLPGYSPYTLASMVTFGFILPTQYAAVAFTGTPSKWILTKILIMLGGSWVCLLAGAAVISAF